MSPSTATGGWCNPHNPTGPVFSRSELERIAELAELHDIMVLSDEVHAPLVLPGRRSHSFPVVGQTCRGACSGVHLRLEGVEHPGAQVHQQAVGHLLAPAGPLGPIWSDGEQSRRLALAFLPGLPRSQRRVDHSIGKPGWWNHRPGGGAGA